MNINYSKDMIEVVHDFVSDNDFNIINNYLSTLPEFDFKDVRYLEFREIEHNIENKIVDPDVIQSMSNIQDSAAKLLIDKYFAKHNLNFVRFTHAPRVSELTRLTKDAFMKPHSDGFESAPLFPNISITGIVYFNDDYNGGELNFPDDGVMIKPQPKDLILFPSHFIHEVMTVLDKDVQFVCRSIMPLVFFCSVSV